MNQKISNRDKEIETLAMNIFETWPRTKIYFGKGIFKEVGTIAAKYGKKALIVIGGGSVKKNGSLNMLLTILDNANIQTSIFEGVEPNPTKKTMETIAKSFSEGNFEIMIALGGGSAMDAAKAALILTSLHETDLAPYFGADMVTKKIERITTPCICIPTTAGTSSEITRYSNVTVPELKVKKLISDIAIHPHVAIVDPMLTTSCPKDLTITVGLDTLTHAMEGYLNVVQDPGNQEINNRALLSIELVFRWLQVAAEDPDNIDARKMMAMASLLGGTVIGGKTFKGTSGPHLNSFSWAESIPHGKSTGITLPYYIVYFAKNPIVFEKLKPIASMLQVPINENLGVNIAKKMLAWYESMGFPTKLKQIEGWKDNYIEKALNDAKQNEMKLKAMPNPVPIEQVREILLPILEAASDGDLTKIK